MNPGNFFAELKRRNVYKVAVAYAVVAWLLIQLASILFPTFEAPAWVMKVFVTLVALGFPDRARAGLGVRADAGRNQAHRGSRFRRIDHAPHWPKGDGICRDRGSCRGRPARVSVSSQEKRAAAERSDASRRNGRRHSAKEHRRPAVREFERRQGERVFRQRHSGRNPDPAGEDRGAESDLAHFDAAVPKQAGNLPEIAKQLGVAHILEGSVQKAGDAVRINVQLIKAEGDSHLWADTYDRKLTDIFAVETEVAQKIAASLEAHLTGGEQKQIAAVPTRNPQAYDAYLRGLALIIRQSPEHMAKGRDYFQQAVQLDPEYAQAWAHLSIAESELYFAGEQTPAHVERARRAAEMAVRLQPELSDAHSAMGLFYYFCLQDFDRALLELDEARKRSPNDGNIIFYTGLVKRRQGKLDEAIELQKKATIFDPRNPDMWSNLGRSYHGKRDLVLAREMFDRAFAVAPDEVQFIAEKAQAYLAEGDIDKAETLLRERDLTESDVAFGEYVDCLVYRRRFDEAVQALSNMLEERKGRSRLRDADGKSWLGGLKLLAGQGSEGRTLLEEAQGELTALRDSGFTGRRITEALIWTGAGLGDRQAVEREAATLINQTQHDLWVAPGSKVIVAAAYSILGDPDRAIPLLEQGLSASYHHAITPAQLRLDPVWDPIRNDPRFQKLAGTKP